MRSPAPLGALVLLCGVAAAHAQETPVRIGTVIDGPWARNAEIRSLFEQEIRELLGSDFTVSFPAASQIVSNWSLDEVQSALGRLLADTTIDAVVTPGLISSVLVTRYDSLPKPVVAPFVPDLDLMGLTTVDGGSGVPNLVYVSHPSSVLRELRAFQEVVDFSHLAILTNQNYFNALPELRTALQAITDSVGATITIVGIDSLEATTVSSLPVDVDAVFLAWLTNLEEGATQRLIDDLNASGIPTMSFFAEDVPRGALMSLNGGNYFPRIARRVALNLQRMLLGEDGAAIAVEFARDEDLTINMATARDIEVYPSFAVMTEATLLNEIRQGQDRHESLSSVMYEAVDVNLDLASLRRSVEASGKDVPIARSALLPQADLVGQALFIDQDRAASSFGSQAERSLYGGVSGSQLLFSEGAWANLSIQQSLQRGRVQNLRSFELDIAYDAAIAYLDLLRAQTFERIARENLDISRMNMDLARVRVTLGSASPGEIYRWDAAVANGRQSVIDANAGRNLAEINLNQLLRRPLEEPFATAETGLADAPLMTGEPNVGQYVENPYNFRLFRAFMVEEALATSPELAELDAAIAAQSRAVTSAKNAYWAPTVALFGDLRYRLAAGGAGSVPGAGLPPGVPVNNEVDWNVGVNFSIPILAGGARPADVERTSGELEALRIRRADVAQRIEQRVRSALHRSGASFANIRLAGDAAAAARQSYVLVSDAYSRGAARQVDLLDAQNTAVLAEFDAANAVYDFLIDFIDVERAVSRFQVFGSDDDRSAFFARLDDYFVNAGVTPPQP